MSGSLCVTIRTMVDIKKDRKSPMWIVTKTDSEGFHRQLMLTEADMDELVRLWVGTLR